VEQFDTKEFRKTLTREENYNRSGYGYKKEMLKQMDVEYTSKFPLSVEGLLAPGQRYRYLKSVSTT
jgi:hypothetical protein